MRVYRYICLCRCCFRDVAEAKRTPTALEWNPDNKLGLACIDSEGNITAFEGMVPSSNSIKVRCAEFLFLLSENYLCLGFKQKSRVKDLG